MGKGFENFMSKKFFHPASSDNMKRVWIAEQKAKEQKKRQEQLQCQYKKEQERYNYRKVLGGEDMDKLTLSFIYEPPEGVKKEETKEEQGEECKLVWQCKDPRDNTREDQGKREEQKNDYKFEWQCKFTAPGKAFVRTTTTSGTSCLGLL